MMAASAQGEASDLSNFVGQVDTGPLETTARASSGALLQRDLRFMSASVSRPVLIAFVAGSEDTGCTLSRDH